MDHDTKLSVDRLLDLAYHMAGGDMHKPVDLQRAGQKLGLPASEMPLLGSVLVEHGYLLAVEHPEKTVFYLTPAAVKKMACIQTRR